MTYKKPKEKICAYSLCGLPFTPSKIGQKTCLNALDGYTCAREHGKELRVLRDRKEGNELIKAMRYDSKKLPEFKADLQDLINKIVRLIDRGHPSMSDNLVNYDADAGHLISRGSDDTLRFHLLNIWTQSSADNRHNGGNPNGMRANLERIFGPELLDEIKGLKAKYPYLGLSKADCLETGIIARKIIRELEADPRILTNSERLEKRREINERLNIYKSGPPIEVSN